MPSRVLFTRRYKELGCKTIEENEMFSWHHVAFDMVTREIHHRYSDNLLK